MSIQFTTKLICTIALLFYQLDYAQNQESGLDESYLVSEYQKFFSETRSILTELTSESKILESNLWENLIQDEQILQNTIPDTYSVFDKKINFSDLGLKWVSDANANFSPGLMDVEDLVSRYRVSTGLDWVILGEGSWFKHKEDLNLLKIRIKRDSLSNLIQYTKFSVKDKLNLIQTVFDQNRIELLEKYSLLIQKSIHFYDLMVERKLFHSSEKIKEEQKLEELNNTIAFYNSYLEKTNEFWVEKYMDLPEYFDDLPDWKSIRDEDLLKEQEELIEIQKSILEKDRRNSDRPSLRARVRYNYYDFERNESRSFASVGLALSVPLQSKKDNSMIEYQKYSYDSQLNFDRIQLKEELLKHHRNFYLLKNKSDKLKNEAIYLQALLDKELEIYAEESHNFSPKNYIRYAEQWIEKKLEILDVQQSLCEEYVIFYALSGLKTDLKEENELSKRSTYLWKKDFYAISNQEILTILQQNEIGTILISPGDSIQKVKEFIGLAQQKNIKVNRLISENSFVITDENIDLLLPKLESLKEFDYSGIHLNIEPHTFLDYRENKTVYIQRMNRVYQIAKLWCKENNKNLSVSIPMNLPIENAEFLAENKITAYIMAYDNKNQMKLLERTENLRTINGKELIWVLKLTDFQDKDEIKEIEQQLAANGIKYIGYYDFSAIKRVF